MLSFIMLIVGFALLVWGADKFVAGASALARRLGVSPLLVGLTIVAFGTSAPELAVSLTAALQGANEIAVGNVVGSNIFNLLVVAGLSAVVCPLVMDHTLLRRDWPLSLLAAIVLCAMIAPDLTISRVEGVILLVFFALTLFFQIRAALKNRNPLEAEEEEALMPPLMIGVNIVLGLACIIIGGQKGPERDRDGQCHRLEHLQHPADPRRVLGDHTHPGAVHLDHRLPGADRHLDRVLPARPQGTAGPRTRRDHGADVCRLHRVSHHAVKKIMEREEKPMRFLLSFPLG